MTKLKVGSILEGFDTRFEVANIVNDKLAVLKVLDCWDAYTKGGPKQGCYGSYLDVGKSYHIRKYVGFSDTECELWIFKEDELKRSDSQLLLSIDENDIVTFDMDS